MHVYKYLANSYKSLSVFRQYFILALWFVLCHLRLCIIQLLKHIYIWAQKIKMQWTCMQSFQHINDDRWYFLFIFHLFCYLTLLYTHTYRYYYIYILTCWSKWKSNRYENQEENKAETTTTDYNFAFFLYLVVVSVVVVVERVRKLISNKRNLLAI